MIQDPISLRRALFRAMRPRQWTKNSFVLAPLLFSGTWRSPLSVGVALAAFAVFCGLSSGVYLINDWFDRDLDCHHPRKRHRPIALGILSEWVALKAAVLLVGAALLGALAIGFEFAGFAVLYTALAVGYSFALKHLVVVDACTVAGGFIIRATAGAVAVDVQFTWWLVGCTAAVSLFLAFGKRRQEFVQLGRSAQQHRPVFAHYRLAWLDLLVVLSCVASLGCYLAYCLLSASAIRYPRLVASLPFFAIGVALYLKHVYQRKTPGGHDDFLESPLFLINGLIWVAVVVWAVGDTTGS